MHLRLVLSINRRLFSTTTVRRGFDPNVEVRVRFGPSPTGHIHLGGLRTAFYNYIFAKQRKGKFILRIEDTDQSRVVPGSADEIEDTLNWASLVPDESPILGGEFGPYTQSGRLDLYRRYAQELIESGKAYKCFCSPTRLELLRKYQARNREKPHYDGKCRNLTPAEIDEKLGENNGLFAVRFALQAGPTVFNDMVFGQIANSLVENLESDPVILKSDGFPTYHFANVIDDHEMKISHVLRGSEWISSTPKHIQIYQAFEWPQPIFAHFPLITMKDGSKMSKRNNQSLVKSLKHAGYRPLALLNFLTNMGGGLPKEKQDSSDLWDLNKIVENFNFDQVSCHPGSVDVERLNRYNSSDLQKAWNEDREEVINQLKNLFIQHNIITDLDDNLLTTILGQFIGRIVTLNELLSHEYIWQQPTLTWNSQNYSGWNLTNLIGDVIAAISKDGDLSQIPSKYQIDKPSLMRLLRLILTNKEQGLPVSDILRCLGKNRCTEYLEEGIKYCGRNKL